MSRLLDGRDDGGLSAATVKRASSKGVRRQQQRHTVMDEAEEVSAAMTDEQA